MDISILFKIYFFTEISPFFSDKSAKLFLADEKFSGISHLLKKEPLHITEAVPCRAVKNSASLHFMFEMLLVHLQFLDFVHPAPERCHIRCQSVYIYTLC